MSMLPFLKARDAAQLKTLYLSWAQVAYRIDWEFLLHVEVEKNLVLYLETKCIW